VADVVVPIYRDVELTRRCLESVLEHSGDGLGRLFLVDDCSPEAEMRPMLDLLRRRDARVRVLETPRNSGFVVTANLGLSASDADCVVLNSDTEVTGGWLTELTGALAASARHVALGPLSNNATLCSVPYFGKAVPVDVLRGRRLDLSGLPRITDTPTLNGFCVLFRRSALRTLGLFDRKYGLGYNEENDWCQRARAAGHLVGRANRALVLHHGSVSFGHARRKRLDVVNERRLVARYPAYLADNARFEASPEAHGAARAVLTQLEATAGA
jgi:O-antigen biosynthesis protein